MGQPLAEVYLRENIVSIARSWIGTPYRSNAMVKGAGVDCGMILIAVFSEAGLVPTDFDPRPYAPQWHIHRNEERYKGMVEKFSKEIPPPPLPGDVVMFKVGRLYAHGAIVTDWPRAIHARAPGIVYEEDLSTNNFGKHALWNAEKRFFRANVFLGS